MLKSILLASSLFFTINSFAQTKITCATGEWENLAQTDGKGAYIELAKKILEPEYQVEVKVLPWARAQKDFADKKVDCLMAETSAGTEPDRIHTNTLLDKSTLMAFTKKSKIPTWNGKESLEKHKLGWVRGYNFNKLTDAKVKFDEVNDAVHGFKMLSVDRIDALIEYDDNPEGTMKKAGVNPADYAKLESGIFEQTYVLFMKDAQGEKLKTKWDSRMAELIKSGEAQAIYKKSNYPSPW